MDTGNDYIGRLASAKRVLMGVLLIGTIMGIVQLVVLKPQLIDRPIDEIVRKVVEHNNQTRDGTPGKMSPEEEEIFRDTMETIKKAILPTTIPLILLWNGFLVVSVWREWICMILTILFLFAVDAGGQFVWMIASHGNALFICSFLVDVLAVYVTYRVQELVRLRRRNPHLFGDFTTMSGQMMGGGGPVRILYGISPKTQWLYIP